MKSQIIYVAISAIFACASTVSAETNLFSRVSISNPTQSMKMIEMAEVIYDCEANQIKYSIFVARSQKNIRIPTPPLEDTVCQVKAFLTGSGWPIFGQEGIMLSGIKNKLNVDNEANQDRFTANPNSWDQFVVRLMTLQDAVKSAGNTALSSGSKRQERELETCLNQLVSKREMKSMQNVFRGTSFAPLMQSVLNGNAWSLLKEESRHSGFLRDSYCPNPDNSLVSENYLDTKTYPEFNQHDDYQKTDPQQIGFTRLMNARRLMPTRYRHSIPAITGIRNERMNSLSSKPNRLSLKKRYTFFQMGFSSLLVLAFLAPLGSVGNYVYFFMVLPRLYMVILPLLAICGVGVFAEFAVDSVNHINHPEMYDTTVRIAGKPKEVVASLEKQKKKYGDLPTRFDVKIHSESALETNEEALKQFEQVFAHSSESGWYNIKTGPTGARIKLDVNTQAANEKELLEKLQMFSINPEERLIVDATIRRIFENALK